MASRKELESLIFYVLGDTNRQLLISSGFDSVSKQRRILALRGLQDLGWISHGGLADFEHSYSLTMEGRRVAEEKPPLQAFDRRIREQVEALQIVDEGANGSVKEGLMKLIEIQCDTGSWDSALLNCFELKRHAERTKDMACLAFALSHQGRVEVAQNRWEDALESFLRAIENYMDVGDRRGVAETNRAMGVVYGNKGDHASAMRCFESSLATAKQLGDLDLMAKAEGNLAIIYDLQGKFEASEAAHKHCLAYFMEQGNLVSANRTCNNLGVLNMSRERYEVAAEYFEKTIESSRALGNREVYGAALVNAGYCYAKTGNTGRALEFTDAAVSIFKETNDANMLALAYRNYGLIEFRNSSHKRGFEWFEKSVRLAESSGVEDTFAACCFEYGLSLIKSMTNPKLAAKLLKKSSAIYMGIGNVGRARRAEAHLASA